MDWRLDASDGLQIARVAVLDDVPGLVHAFSTRGPVAAPLDVGLADAGDRRPRERFCRAAGFRRVDPVLVRQVHGPLVVDAAVAAAAAVPPQADGLVATAVDGNDRPIAVRSADCVGILLADARGRAWGAVHAGWRGIAARIAPLWIERAARLGVDAVRLRVALGPSIGPCCYAVGADVVLALAAAARSDPGAIERRTSDGRVSVDLHAALALQLARAGVDPFAIAAAPWCTSCRADLFFSWRRDGERAGRQAAAIGPGAS
jgi:YfiH family protein